MRGCILSPVQTMTFVEVGDDGDVGWEGVDQDLER